MHSRGLGRTLTSFHDFRQLNGSSLMFAFNGSHLMPSGTFSATLTTKAFDPSRLRWFATRSCKPVARGHVSTCCRSLSHLLRRLLRHTLIHTPGGANRLGEPSPALLELRDVARNPAEDGGMGNLDTALCHHLHQIAIRQPIGDIPSHAQLNDVGVESTFAVHWVTDYRLGHSAPRAVNSAVYPMPQMHQNPNVFPLFTQTRSAAWPTKRFRFGLEVSP